VVASSSPLPAPADDEAIFISIAAYRDVELWATIENAVATARLPERLHFAVLDQAETPATAELQAKAAPARLTYVHLQHQFSRGPCWARSLIASLRGSEPYFFQIDSHMQFDDAWDDYFITWHRHLAITADKPIISTYPCAFERGEAGEVIKRPMEGHVLELRPKGEASLAGDSPVMGFVAIPRRSDAPLPGYHIGAGCVFTSAKLLQQVPIDPLLYFHGEEQNWAVRAWTHGWNIWHTPNLPVYHLYHSGQGRPVHWAEGDDSARKVRWWSLNNQSTERMRSLLFEQRDLGAFGLGQARNLVEYAVASGIDYPGRVLLSEARRA